MSPFQKAFRESDLFWGSTLDELGEVHDVSEKGSHFCCPHFEQFRVLEDDLGKVGGEVLAELHDLASSDEIFFPHHLIFKGDCGVIGEEG